MKKKKTDQSMLLEKNKYYIVLSDLEDDKFHMVTYDTTGKVYDCHEDHSVASIMYEGLLALLRRKGDTVFRCGETEIEFNFNADEIEIDFDEDLGEILDTSENVVKVDFRKD